MSLADRKAVHTEKDNCNITTAIYKEYGRVISVQITGRSAGKQIQLMYKVDCDYLYYLLFLNVRQL